MPKRVIQTYAQWQEAIEQVNRLVVDHMTVEELDLAAALLYARPVLSLDQRNAVDCGDLVPELRTAVKLPARAEDPPMIMKDGQWSPFAVTSDWNAFGALLTGVEFVFGTHEGEDKEGKLRFWYSAHAFLSGTRCEAYVDDPRQILAMCAALLLRHSTSTRKFC